METLQDMRTTLPEAPGISAPPTTFVFGVASQQQQQQPALGYQDHPTPHHHPQFGHRGEEGGVAARASIRRLAASRTVKKRMSAGKSRYAKAGPAAAAPPAPPAAAQPAPAPPAQPAPAPAPAPAQESAAQPAPAQAAAAGPGADAGGGGVRVGGDNAQASAAGATSGVRVGPGAVGVAQPVGIVPTVGEGRGAGRTEKSGRKSSGSREDRAAAIMQQQQRLLLLRHASRCRFKKPGQCLVSPQCHHLQKLWKHMAECKDKDCMTPHCVSSRFVLSHYHHCRDPKCQLCGPVRVIIARECDQKRLHGPTSSEDDDGDDDDDEDAVVVGDDDDAVLAGSCPDDDGDSDDSDGDSDDSDDSDL